MAADMESGKTDIGFVVNKTIELRTSSFYVLAADLLKSCPKGAEIFTSWLGSVITDEAEKIDRGTGLGIIMNLIGNFYQLEDGNLFECLMDQIDSEDWFRKLTEEQKSALAKSIIDHIRPSPAPIPDSVTAILRRLYIVSIPYILDSKLDSQQQADLLMSMIETKI